MATLKSFELKGNKKSFANWISNLSPTHTPFTSMISKEQIDQTQYSWQTDSLARASGETFTEGSQAESQSRASTKVYTNFTSILRRGAKVSDTEQVTANYGRNEELAYQMGKAGKELLRDVEVSNLSIRKGNIGSDTDASKHSGFRELCAPLFSPDPDSYAVTHQAVAVVHGEHWFTLKDIFKVTTELYVSGSKADKIMFHPNHVRVFSDQLGFNKEEPLIYRMFDDLDTKFNANVAKIRDPLGREYTLIPNRFMPENSVYIFHEGDWTQMVLREPKRTQLAKKGSYTETIVEAEVGLKHKNPYASGVLDMKVVNYTSDLESDALVISTVEGDQAELFLQLHRLDGTVGNSVDFHISVSDLDIATPSSKGGQTNDNGMADFYIDGEKPGRITVYVYRDDVSHVILSKPVIIDIVPAEVFMGGDDHEMAMGERISFETVVRSPINPIIKAPVGTDVKWFSNSDNIVFVDNQTGAFIGPNPTVVTAGQDERASRVKIAAKAPGNYEVWAESDGIKSKVWAFKVTPAGLKLEWAAGNEDLFTVDHSKDVELSIRVKKRDGQPVPDGTEVSWGLQDLLGNFENLTTTTIGGVTTNKFTANKAGETIMTFSAYGDVLGHPITCMNMAVSTTLHPSNTLAIGDKPALQTFVTDARGTPIKGKTVHWAALPSSFGELGSISGVTNDQGIAETTFRGQNRGTGNISTTIERVEFKECKFFVGIGAEAELHIDPNPTRAGDEVRFAVTLVGNDGVAIAGKAVTFTSDPLLADLSPMNGNTEADGTHTSSFTFTEATDSTILASVTGFDCLASESLLFEDTVYDYTVSGETSLTMLAGSSETLTYTVKRGNVPVQGITISAVLDNNIATLTYGGDPITNVDGQATVNLEVLRLGNANLIFKVKGKSNTITTPVSVRNPAISFTINPNPATMGQNVVLGGSALDANGNGVSGVNVAFVASPTCPIDLPEVTTDSDGNYQASVPCVDNSDREFYAYLVKDSHIHSDTVNLTVNI